MNSDTQTNETENLALIHDTANKIVALLEPLGLDEQVAAVGLADTLAAYKAAIRSQAELDALGQKPVVSSHQLGQLES